MKRHTEADASEEDRQEESSAAILGSPPEEGVGFRKAPLGPLSTFT